jgi:phosphohistidine phosphatase
MRRLLLLRHAKAERSQPGGRDFERALTGRGRSDAQKLGAYLNRHALVPDLAMVSPATRTRESWDLVAATLPDAKVRLDERLYDATPQAILQAIRSADPAVGTLLVVGHNPGLQELAAMLVAAGDNIGARQRLNEHFPTCALAVIEFAIDDWARTHPNGGRLEHFVAPKSLETATD